MASQDHSDPGPTLCLRQMRMSGSATRTRRAERRGVRRLAVPVEDHSLAAGDYEGVRAGQARGTGAVIIWDEGDAEVIRDEPGHLSVLLHGSKLAGGFALTRTGERRWVLVKTRDGHARPGSDIVAEQPGSVRSGRTWEDLASGQTGVESSAGDRGHRPADP